LSVENKKSFNFGINPKNIRNIKANEIVVAKNKIRSPQLGIKLIKAIKIAEMKKIIVYNKWLSLKIL